MILFTRDLYYVRAYANRKIANYSNSHVFSALNRNKACKAKAVCQGKTGPDAGGVDGKTTARAAAEQQGNKVKYSPIFLLNTSASSIDTISVHL